MTTDRERLSGYVDIWKSAVDDVVALLRALDDEDWSKPTDLPGWDVKAVASHLAHLESELAGMTQDPVEVPELEHVTSPTSSYTERGPVARAAWAPTKIVDELVEAAEVRLAALRENPPADGAAQPPITPGGIGWNWETLLRNRPLDVWMHEQDIRRAVGRPGGLATAAAAHTTTVFTMSLPYTVGKRVAPPPGTIVVVDVHGVRPAHLAIRVNEDGRAVPETQDPDDPTVTLRMDLESFIVLAGGRRPPESVEVRVDGDEELGRRILKAMTVTP